MGSAGGKSPIGRVIGTLFGFGMLALVVVVFLGSKGEPGVGIRSGGVVTPTNGSYVVYLEEITIEHPLHGNDFRWDNATAGALHRRACREDFRREESLLHPPRQDLSRGG